MSCWKQIYRQSPVSLNFYIFYSFFVNGPQAPYVNPECRKCNLGINLSPANKTLLTLTILFRYLVLTR